MKRIIDMLLILIYIKYLVLPVERYFYYILHHYYPSLHNGEKNFRNGRIQERKKNIFMLPPLITLGESLTTIKENFEKYVFFTYFIIC